MSDNEPKPRSIARKLSGKLFRRLLGTFIWVDVLLALIFFASVAAWCEVGASQAFRDGRNMQPVPVESIRGIYISEPFSYILPENTRYAAREITWRTDGGNGVTVVFYNVTLRTSDDSIEQVKIDVLPALNVARFAFAALLILELLHLLTKSVGNARIVKKMLAPITRLATTAETLGRASAAFRPDQLDELRGALDNISAGTLDTRLEVNGTQKELRGLASAINGMLDRLSESYTAQMRFVSDASHELRTPIAVIQGYAGLLDRWGKHDEKTLQEAIDAIKSESENMKRLIERLLFLARGDSGNLEMSPETFDLAELVYESTQEARLIDELHDYIVETEPAPVYADRAQTKEALRVLLDNAAKYTDADGQITLRTGRHGELESFASVTDTGVGIAPEDLPRIFDRFVRTDESRARVSGGAGLGLAIAKRIVTVSGGYLEAVSRVGLGTRMTIILPSGEEK